MYRASYGQVTNSATGEGKKSETHKITYKERHINHV
jgi:hypothetical protein